MTFTNTLVSLVQIVADERLSDNWNCYRGTDASPKSASRTSTENGSGEEGRAGNDLLEARFSGIADREQPFSQACSDVHERKLFTQVIHLRENLVDQFNTTPPLTG
jgi:hypothetical protein